MLAAAVEDILARGDLALAQKRAIAATVDAAVNWSVDVEETGTVEPDE